MTPATHQLDADSIRAALRAVFAAREYRWQATSSTWTWLMSRWERLLDWLDGLRMSAPARYYLVVAILVLLLTVLVVQLVWVIKRSLKPASLAPGAVLDAAAVHDARWHLAEAQRLSAAGQFAAALAHRFLAVVLELDARQLLHFDPSKTPAEYVDEVRFDAAGRSQLGSLVSSLYRHVFGGASCDEAAWTLFDSQAAALAAHAAAR